MTKSDKVILFSLFQMNGRERVSVLQEKVKAIFFEK